MADIETPLLADAMAPATQVALSAATPHLQKAANLAANWALRAAGTGFAAAVSLPFRTDQQSWHELWRMQHSAWQRQRQMQENWLQGWLDWVTECTQARGANTMARLVGQEFDLVAQWQELVATQVTDVVELLENLEINYAYWLNEKLR